MILLHHAPQEPAGPDGLLLADEFLERPRPHPLRQRRKTAGRAAV